MKNIDVTKDCFKFSTAIFPRVTYTWHPLTNEVSWVQPENTAQELQDAADAAGIPSFMREDFYAFMKSTAGVERFSTYSFENAQKYVDNGDWVVVS